MAQHFLVYPFVQCQQILPRERREPAPRKDCRPVPVAAPERVAPLAPVAPVAPVASAVGRLSVDRASGSEQQFLRGHAHAKYDKIWAIWAKTQVLYESVSMAGMKSKISNKWQGST